MQNESIHRVPYLLDKNISFNISAIGETYKYTVLNRYSLYFSYKSFLLAYQDETWDWFQG